MKVLIFGYGLHGGGFDSALYFLSRGDEVIITDIRRRELLGESVDYLESKGAIIHCGGHMTDDFMWADLVIKTPAIKLDNEFLKFAKRVENDLTYVYSRPESQNIKIICVTGSKNKTHISSALCHSLNRLGKKTHMCGNMGISAFSEIKKWDAGDFPEYVILELSVWQARDIYAFMKGHVPHIEISLVTSVYDQANQTSQSTGRMGIFNLHANSIVCPKEMKDEVTKLAAKKAKNITSIESASHSMSKSLPQNMTPAFAALKKLGFSTKDINAALKSFKGIPNRDELILRTDNTMYINDSSSIIPAAVNFTMENFEMLPVHLICGGSDSSLEPAPMLKSIRAAASVHLLDGTFTQKKLIPLLQKNGIAYNGPYESMMQAVEAADSRINKDSLALQVVMLSPGASAFEQFENEFSRGEAFTKAVLELNS